MNRYVVLPIALFVIFCCGSAMAQIVGQDPTLTSPLGATSPLGLGPGMPVAPTGIPMGATELASPGIGPPPDMSSTAMPTGSVFDGGGMTTMTGGNVPTTVVGAMTNPSTSASAPMPMTSLQTVGRLGIPLGSVELGGGGLSPLPDPVSVLVPMAEPAAPSAFVAPTVMAPTAMAAPATTCVTTSVPSAGAATAPGGC